MQNTQTWNHNIATIANSLLLVWWGMVILIPPLTIGMGAIGTGLILLAVNAARLAKGIPTRGSTTALGIIAIFWGALVWALQPLWYTAFAMLLIIVGIVLLTTLLARPQTES